VTISFTLIALAAARENPDVGRLVQGDDRDAALVAMSDGFAAAGSPVLGTVFFAFIGN